MTKGANNYQHSLHDACYHGHLEIAQLMIAKGANDWNGGFYYACLGGHLTIAKLIFSKGVDNWNHLYVACKPDMLEFAQSIATKGPIHCRCEEPLETH